MIKLLIFDVGGTLLEFHSNMRKIDVKILRELFNINAKENEIQEIIDDIDLKYADSHISRTPFSVLISKAILKRYDIPISKYKEFMNKRNDVLDHSKAKLYPDALPVIKKVKSKYSIATLANVHDTIFHKKTLNKTGLIKYFHFHVDSDSAGIRKPDIRIFKLVLNHFKIKPSEAIMIGDTPTSDIWGAKRLGIHTILINRRKLPYNLSNKTKPDFEITSLYQLSSTLNKFK
jgi:putative hydrolase of the HAD superfamily